MWPEASTIGSRYASLMPPQTAAWNMRPHVKQSGADGCVRRFDMCGDMDWMR